MQAIHEVAIGRDDILLFDLVHYEKEQIRAADRNEVIPAPR
jgi:hypothetical protein